MKDIRVISSDLDGLELRREKAKTPAWIRCEGNADRSDRRGKAGVTLAIPADAWERIFGRQS